MIAKIYVSGIIGEDTTLLDVVRQVKGFSDVEGIEVHIDSIGGSVEVGQSIFDYLRNAGVPIKTVAHQAFSIATTIFMAGDERVVMQGEDRILIHMPWVQNMNGGSKDLDKMSKELKAIENEFVKFYSIYASVDEDTIRTLLENETFLSGDEAFDMGLATVLEIPLKAVAFINKDEIINTKQNVIMKNVNSLIKALKKFVGEEEGSDELVALILQDANGVEVNFPDLAEDAIPSVGDKAEIDGQPAEGEVTFPDGSVLVFVGGALESVVPAEQEEEGEEDADAEESQEEGEEEENNDANAEENEEESEEEADVLSEEEELDLLLKQLFGKLSADIEAKNKQVIDDLNAEIIALKKLIGSEDVQINISDPAEIKKTLPKGLQRASEILHARKRK